MQLAFVTEFHGGLDQLVLYRRGPSGLRQSVDTAWHRQRDTAIDEDDRRGARPQRCGGVGGDEATERPADDYCPLGAEVIEHPRHVVGVCLEAIGRADVLAPGRAPIVGGDDRRRAGQSVDQRRPHDVRRHAAMNGQHHGITAGPHRDV